MTILLPLAFSNISRARSFSAVDHCRRFRLHKGLSSTELDMANDEVDKDD